MRRAVVVALLASTGCGRIGFTSLDDTDAAAGSALEDATPLACAAAPCAGSVAVECGGRCYASCPVATTFMNAQSTCVAWGGTLVSIHSQADIDCLAMVGTGVDAWIGLVQPNGQATPSSGWMWLDGSPMDFTRWNMGPVEPNDSLATVDVEDDEEQCAAMYPNGQWNDSRCAVQDQSLCVR